MRLSVILCTIAFVAAAEAQVAMVSGSYFPSGLEVRELQTIASEKIFDDPALLVEVEDGGLISDVGFDRFSQRAYSTDEWESVSIEIVVLKDARAAFSLLTLLRSSDIQDGPPGEACTYDRDGIRFAQGKHWIRIRNLRAPRDLLNRIALAVSNRIGPRQEKPPALIAHFPKLGYDPSSLKYIIGPKSFQSHSSLIANGQLKFDTTMEIAQARYSVEGQNGILSLISFPTSQVADEYFSGLAGPESAEKNRRTYAKKVGPILGILDGSFSPDVAEKIMNSIQYAYSIRWIYEKKLNTATVWGVPVGILGTVVRSLLFVALLCVLSIFAGIGFAGLRFMARRYESKNAPDKAGQSGNTYLRIR